MKNRYQFRALLTALLFLAVTTGCSEGKPSENPGDSSLEESMVSTEPGTDSEKESMTEKVTGKSTETSKESETPTTEKNTGTAQDDTDYNWMVPSYYQPSIDLTLRKAALKTNLFNIINKHTAIGYDGLYSAYLKTDLREDGTIWDMYSNIHYKPSQNGGSYKTEGDMYNREHTIPQSVFDKQSTMRCDIFHVYPTDGKINGNRSNYPHAEVGTVTNTACNPSTNGSKLGVSKTPGVSGKVFEPADEYKGDFARTYFYFVTCYQDRMASFKDYACFSKNSYPSLSSWAIDLYKKWSKEDPVSEKEIKRNEAAYGIQKNRNPFIDFPGIENLIW